ncbi:2-isopropylmalate synthase [Nymphon striatum]|nr:2-isopropylmalate synthase [Nymphon striatum]
MLEKRRNLRNHAPRRCRPVRHSPLPLGKHSGRAALRAKLKDLGVDVGDNQLKDVFVRFKELADRKKEVYDDDILALVSATVDDQTDQLQLCGTGGPAEATLEMEIDGVEKIATCHGDGPVDASFKAVRELHPNAARLQLYQVSAVTEGTDAQATVSVRLEEDGMIATGQSADYRYRCGINQGLYPRTEPSSPGPGADAREINYKDVT